jgi:hypothetical protein
MKITTAEDRETIVGRSIIADPTFDYCLSQGFVGYWLVSSIRQAFDSYLGGPLNGETFPQTTGGTGRWS